MESEAVVGISERLRGRIHEMSQKTVEMLRLAWEGFRKQETGPLEPAEKLGREIHQLEKVLTELAVKRLTGQAGGLGADQELFFVPMHLDRGQYRIFDQGDKDDNSRRSPLHRSGDEGG